MKISIGLSSYFRGMAPAVSPKRLLEGDAQEAVNVKLISRDLQAYNDLQPTLALAVSAPVNTINEFDGTHWLQWAEASLFSGFNTVDVTLGLIAEDPSYRTFIAGAAGSNDGTVPIGPRVTNVTLATDSSNQGSAPAGAYPYKTKALTINPPLEAPVVTSTGASDGTLTDKQTFNGSDISGWVFQVYGGQGGYDNGNWAVNASVGNPAPSFYGYSVRSNQVVLYRDFSLTSAKSFIISFDIERKVFTTDGQATIYFLSTGNSGPNIFLDSSGAVTYSEGTGSSQGHSGAPGNSTPFHLNIAGTLQTSGDYFDVTVTFTPIGGGPATLTFTGIAKAAGGQVGFSTDNSTGQHDAHDMWVDNIVVSSVANGVAPTLIYTNYVSTNSNYLGSESAPSPTSTTVTIDNGEVNTVLIPFPDPTEDVQKVNLYRAASSSTTTVDRFITAIPIGRCTVSGTGDAIVLTSSVTPVNGDQYLFAAISANTGATTINLNGTGALPVVTEIITEFPNTTATSGVSGQAVIKMTSTSNIVAGQRVIDSTNTAAIPENTTVASVVTDTSITLSANLEGAGVAEGDLLRFFTTTYTALVANNILAGGNYAARYDTTRFVLFAGGIGYIDTNLTSELGDILVTANFDTPPPTIRGFIALPNNTLAGHTDTELCISAEGYFYAFPLENRRSVTDTKIVVIGAIDSTVLILTESFPYTAYGDTPSGYTMLKEEFSKGCTSARSRAFIRKLGITYSCAEGIAAYSGQGRIQLLTKELFTLEQWQALNPSSILGIAHNDRYYFWYQTLSSQKGGYILDVSEEGAGLVQLGFHATAAWVNPLTDTLYVCLDSGTTQPANELLAWDSATTLLPYRWKSKKFVLGWPTSYAYGQIKAFDYINLTAKIYADGTLIFTAVITSMDVFPIPTAIGATYEIEISGTSWVYQIEIAEDSSELL